MRGVIQKLKEKVKDWELWASIQPENGIWNHPVSPGEHFGSSLLAKTILES